MTETSRATISAQPDAELAPRKGDEILRSDELKQFELFANLNRPVNVERFPGSIVLRRFRKGDQICRQGDRGHSAFYIVRVDDMQKLRDFRARRSADDSATSAKASVDQPAAETSARQVATAYISSGQTKAAPGFLSKLFNRNSRAAEQTRPQYISNDGPTDIDYATRTAPMCEGDVFGEMSCMTLAPRSASVVVDEDCYMVEFLRNIFDQMQRDEGYRQKTDEVYAQRVLSTHLRRLELFQDLTNEQIDFLRHASHLELVEPGSIICDEGEQSDNVYLIRSGVVQVVRGAHVAFRVSDIADWPKFCQALLAADPAQSAEKKDSPPAKPAGGSAVSAISAILAAARGGKSTASAAKPKPMADASSTEVKGETPAVKKPAKAKPGSAIGDILAAARGGGKPAASDATAQPEPTAKKKPRAVADAKDVLAAARAAMKPKELDPATPPAKRPAKATSTSVADIMAAAKKPPVPKDTPHPVPPAGDETAACLVAKAPASTGDPMRYIWSWLSPRVQSSLRLIANGEPSLDDHRRLVVQAINELIRQREFIASADMLGVLERPVVRGPIDAFPQGVQGAKKKWSELEVRIAGALAFRELFGAALSKVPPGKSPPDILAYLSRGECFGEMAVVLQQPRQATCIAYDHPSYDSSRRPGRVELVRIEGAAFQKLLDDSPALRTAVDKIVSKRFAGIVGSDLRQAGDADTSLTHSEEFRDRGLVQGQNLLLIDLDRCTRCGDCVRACVNTHDDGYSRLFLDGPRFDRFLVPSACRQCLNPSCMIGCPVSAIQRGNNGQIEIRDWCIGCGVCARQCPYDSIQMHDLGIISEPSVGWRFASASRVGDSVWQDRRYQPNGWSVGVAPFTWTIDLVEALEAPARAKSGQTTVGRLAEPIYFRYEFQLSRKQLREGPFALAVTSKEMTVRAWINGTVIAGPAPANPRARARVDELKAQVESSQLRRGSNLLAVEVTPPPADESGSYAPKYNQSILSARLDRVPKAGALALATVGEEFDLRTDVVEKLAVVCDLCSSLASQRPACVDQCPHEAAIRVDARSEFPTSF